MTVTTTFLAEEEPTVFIVYEDPAISRVLKPLVASRQWRLESFASPQTFLETCDPGRPGCLLLNLPGRQTHGLAWLARLAPLGIHLPVVVISACGEVSRVVEAMRAGARNYLKKPCDEDVLAAALRDALDWDAENRRRLAERLRLQRRLSRLTPGEHDVLRLLVDGRSNRQVADALGISVRAVEVRRAKVMQKMRAESLAELVRLALAAMPEPAHQD